VRVGSIASAGQALTIGDHASEGGVERITGAGLLCPGGGKRIADHLRRDPQQPGGRGMAAANGHVSDRAVHAPVRPKQPVGMRRTLGNHRNRGIIGIYGT
jgi:hypothetical protein